MKKYSVIGIKCTRQIWNFVCGLQKRLSALANRHTFRPPGEFACGVLVSLGTGSAC